jgi:hypothetical protein
MVNREFHVPSPRALSLVAALMFVTTAFLRTRHITDRFELLGDQVLYWDIALRPWSALPLGGGPSSVGGTTIGPAFIWFMWAIRHLVGPWTGNLPHAGGIGISLFQSTADALLVVALWKRFGSLALALAIALIVATAPEDMSLSASIWNPPVAVALVKISMACALLLGTHAGSLWWLAGATASAILAVQSHSSAVFFAGPAIVSLTTREIVAGRRTRAWRAIIASAAIALVLEAPYLINLVKNPTQQTRPAVVLANVSYTIQHPTALRPRAAFEDLARASDAILIRPWAFSGLSVLMAICIGLTAFRTRRDPALAGVSFAPLLAAVAGFSFWQGPFEFYWYMTLMPSVALTIGLGLTAWKPGAPIVAAALFLLILIATPRRFAYAQTINRLPTYGVLVRGSREIRQHVDEIRSLAIEFAVEPSTNTHFIYERVLGGRVTAHAPFAATIEKTGRVRFTAVTSTPRSGGPR